MYILKLKNMKKLRLLSLLSILALLFALHACKKLSNIELDFTTSILKVKMTSETVDSLRINKRMVLAAFNQNISITDSIDKGVILADSNGFLTDRTKILNAKISHIRIENQNLSENDPDDNTKPRSFYSYFDSLGVYIRFGTAFNPTEDVTNPASGYQMMGAYALTQNDKNVFQIPGTKTLKDYLPNPLPSTATPIPSVIVLVGKCKRVIPTGKEFKISASANVSVKVTKK